MWFPNYFISGDTLANQEPKFTIADTKFYVPVVVLLTQENSKLLQQLKSGFNPIHDGGCKKAPYPFFPCNFYISKL